VLTLPFESYLGGLSVSTQSSPANCPVSPAQVWAHLAIELQERAIRLMAQLAYNLVTAQSGWPNAKDKESKHVIQSYHPQDPA
jgi:sugar phosphate isomerase/epimerase